MSTSEDSTDQATDAHARALALLDDEQYSKYLLQSKNEMLPVLRGLVDAVAQLTMFFNEGRDMVLTCLARADDQMLVLDFGPDIEMNRKALMADRLFCVTQLDKVKIQFVLRGVRKVEFNGRSAFAANLPDGVLRLQRREFFRLSLPLTRPLACTVAFPASAGGAPITLACSVGDLSGGGLGLIALPADLPITPGMELSDLRLDLPEVGLITARLKVCSIIDTTNRAGVSSKRAGCEFINLPGPMTTLLQRYIIKVERERKARASGL